jgi:anti-sigma B factor antagonist
MSDESQANLQVTEQKSVTVVEFQDRKILEEFLITQIGEKLDQLIATQDNMKLLLTFKNVEHLSSAALGMLITLHNKVKETDGRLMLSDINPQIYQVFEITKLDRLFDIHPTAKQALAQA